MGRVKAKKIIVFFLVTIIMLSTNIMSLAVISQEPVTHNLGVCSITSPAGFGSEIYGENEYVLFYQFEDKANNIPYVDATYIWKSHNGDYLSIDEEGLNEYAKRYPYGQLTEKKIIEVNGYKGFKVRYEADVISQTGEVKETYYREEYEFITDHYIVHLTIWSTQDGYLDTKQKEEIVQSIKIYDTTNIYTTGLPFSDVKTSMWYYPVVKYCYQNHLIEGTTDTTFAPNENLSRAMLVTILWRMASTPSAKTSNAFPDVKEGLWYTNAIKWATGEKIVSGYDNGKFGPSDSITREQLAVILRNYANYKKKNTNSNTSLNQYQDGTEVSSWAKSAVQWAVGKKIVSGKNNGTNLDPKGTATRAEAAAMINNYVVNVK